MGLRLNKFDFTKMIPTREQRIQSASAKPVPELDTYAPNRLAKELHPDKQYVKIARITERGNDVKTFTLVPDKEKGTEKLAYFSAGQYLSIELKVGDATITRPYSISSSPKDALDGRYELTIKRVDGGLATNYILDEWTEGTELTVSAPEGEFCYEPLRDAETVVGIAGGSGITPFVSLANAIADGDEEANLVLLYGSRTADEILFKAELDEIEKKCDKVKVVHVLSAETKDGYEHGFITAELIKKYAPNKEYSVFMCGPQAMYDFVDKETEKLHIRRKFVRHEVFGEYYNPDKNADYPVKAKGSRFNLTVIIRDEKYEIECDANETVLNAIERAGIKAPAKCRSGVCGYCHSRLIDGKVYVPKSVDGRRLADYDYGYVHPCCSFPISNVTIDVPPTK